MYYTEGIVSIYMYQNLLVNTCCVKSCPIPRPRKIDPVTIPTPARMVSRITACARMGEQLTKMQQIRQK